MIYVLHCHGNNKAAPFFFFSPSRYGSLKMLYLPLRGRWGGCRQWRKELGTPCWAQKLLLEPPIVTNSE